MREGNRNLRTPIEYGEVATTGQAKPRSGRRSEGARRAPHARRTWKRAHTQGACRMNRPRDYASAVLSAFAAAARDEATNPKYSDMAAAAPSASRARRHDNTCQRKGFSAGR